MPETPRERLLETATNLLYRDGIQAVGINRIVAEAEVALMTLYRQFGDKDKLVAAALENWSTQWLHWLADHIDRRGDDAKARAGAQCTRAGQRRARRRRRLARRAAAVRRQRHQCEAPRDTRHRRLPVDQRADHGALVEHLELAGQPGRVVHAGGLGQLLQQVPQRATLLGYAAQLTRRA